MKVHQFGGKKAMPIHALEQAVLEDWPVSGSGFSYMCSPLIWVSNSLGMNCMLTVIDSESCIFNFKHKFDYKYRGNDFFPTLRNALRPAAGVTRKLEGPSHLRGVLGAPAGAPREIF